MLLLAITLAKIIKFVHTKVILPMKNSYFTSFYRKFAS